MADRRIGGAGGGSDPGKPKSKATGVIVAAAVVAGLSAAAGGATVTDSVGAGLDAAAQQSAETRAANGRDSAAKGDDAETWKRLALQDFFRLLHQLAAIEMNHQAIRPLN